MRTIDGEVLIDGKGEFNEQAWINNCIAIGSLLAELHSDDGGETDD